MLLSSDPISACTEALKDCLPRNWDAKQFVSRVPLERALRQFLSAQETLFVLVGMSGVGKSWAIASWMTQVIPGHMRVLIRGTELYDYKELNTLVAGKFRRFAPADWIDQQFLHHLRAVASVEGRGPFIIVVDDLHFPAAKEGAITFLHRLVRLFEHCREYGIKLIFTCQKNIWASYRFSKEIPPHAIFSIEPLTEPVFTAQIEKREASYSFLLTDLTPDELTEVFKQHVSLEAAEKVALQLRASAFNALRSPYLLALYIKQNKAHLDKLNATPIPVDINKLLDKRINDALLVVADRIGVDEYEVREALDALQKKLWETRPNGLTPTAVKQVLNTYLSELSNNALRELRQVGLLTNENPVQFAEPAVAEHLYAVDLKQGLQDEEDIIGKLFPEVDAGVVSALLRDIPEPVI